MGFKQQAVQSLQLQSAISKIIPLPIKVGTVGKFIYDVKSDSVESDPTTKRIFQTEEGITKIGFKEILNYRRKTN